jgi:hypothetical protein
MKDESKGFKEETAKPRMLVTLEKPGGAWNVWDATDWQDTEHGWETVQNRVNGLFYSYRTAPTRAEIEQALKHLQSFGKGNKLLSTCFPSAGSRPEMWDEFFAAYPGQLEFVYDEAQSMDFILREYYRVYGVENLDFAEPVFVLSLRKPCELDEERFPSIGHFFREDGNGDEIRIVVRVGEYGTYYMSAALWAGSRIAASQQYIIAHYAYRRLEACTNLDAPRIVETELDGGVYLITENVGSAPFYRADFDFPATSFGEATLFLNREGRIIGHYMYE